MSLKSLHINVTNRCNMFCNYCYFYEDSVNVSETEPTLDQLVSYIDDAEEIGVKLIVISGGEPLLRSDIFEILNYGNTPKILLTNSTLLTEKKVSILNNISSLKDVKISFDGFIGHDKNRGNGNSEIVQKRIKMLDDVGIFPYTIDTVITKENYNELSQIYEFIVRSKCYRWEVDFPLMRGRAKNKNFSIEDKDIFYTEYIIPLIKQYIKDEFPFKLNMIGVLRWELFNIENNGDFKIYTGEEHPCSYAIDSFTVHTNGDISLCPSLSTVFENVKKINIKNILNSTKYQIFKSLKISDIKKCHNCRYLNLCGGGCRADALAINHSLESHDTMSCERMLYFEKYILGILPKSVKERIESLICKNGVLPEEVI